MNSSYTIVVIRKTSGYHIEKDNSRKDECEFELNNSSELDRNVNKDDTSNEHDFEQSISSLDFLSGSETEASETLFNMTSL